MTDEIYSTGDNEAKNPKDSEVSFVLERKSTDSNSSPNKMGLFSIALVMCICSLSSFFAPMGSEITTDSGTLNSGKAYNPG